jgi:hypothetical protein
MTEEKWALHHETGYEVSTLGQVRKPGKSPRKTKSIGKNYTGVNIVHKGKHKTFYVHRLVLETFSGPAPSIFHEASHLNGVKSDNRLDNLVWETSQENAARRRLHGTSGAGADNSMVKLKIWQALFVKYSKATSKSLARKFGITTSMINDIRAERTWGCLNGQ